MRDLIVQRTRERLSAEKNRLSPSAMREQALDSAVPRPLLQVFKKRPVLISEVKFVSPSRGVIRQHGDPVVIASEYLTAGTDVISVLTEPEFFKGSLQYLSSIRQALPESLLLMKDFILEPYQVFQARACGANVFLLIAELFSLEALDDLIQLGKELGLTALVEVDSLAGLQRVYMTSAELIGVNNRNLRDLSVDTAKSFELAPFLDRSRKHISESGISSRENIIRLSEAGYDGFLIGSHLMAAPKPGEALAELAGAL